MATRRYNEYDGARQCGGWLIMAYPSNEIARHDAAPPVQKVAKIKTTMKKLLTGTLAILLISPLFAHAQSTTAETPTQLRLTLIALIEEVVQLENQLIAMQQTAQSPSTLAPMPTAAPNVTAAPMTQPQVAAAPAPAVAADPSQPSGYSINIVAWPGPIPAAQVTQTFVTDPTLTSWDQDTTDNSHVNIGAILLDPNGKPINNAVMTVTTDDLSQNVSINGTGNIYGNPAVAYYSYHYVFKTSGSHTIIFSAMGATNSITLQSN